MIFYVHPWETDPGQPRVQLSRSKSFRHYFNLDKTLARLDHLLRDFEFAPIKEILPSNQANRHESFGVDSRDSRSV